MFVINPEKNFLQLEKWNHTRKVSSRSWRWCQLISAVVMVLIYAGGGKGPVDIWFCSSLVLMRPEATANVNGSLASPPCTHPIATITLRFCMCVFHLCLTQTEHDNHNVLAAANTAAILVAVAGFVLLQCLKPNKPAVCPPGGWMTESSWLA